MVNHAEHRLRTTGVLSLFFIIIFFLKMLWKTVENLYKYIYIYTYQKTVRAARTKNHRLSGFDMKKIGVFVILTENIKASFAIHSAESRIRWQFCCDLEKKKTKKLYNISILDKVKIKLQKIIKNIYAIYCK